MAVVLLGFSLYVGKVVWDDPAWETTQPEVTGLPRHYADDVLVSDDNPVAQIKVSDAYDYLGGQKFTLYGTVAVDQYFYVQRDEAGHAQSIIRLQFESVLPGVDHAYDYSDAPLRTQIDGLDFFTLTEAASTGGLLNTLFPYGKPGSDRYQAHRFLASHGVEIPGEYAFARLVHIPDEAARHEMIVFFYDDMPNVGIAPENLGPDGAGSEQWADISHDLLAKITTAISFAPAQDRNGAVSLD
ncbi:hypothetical protein [Pseudoblastomonas halimionae]|uniref:Uncharacterized protein n=1 Tax=Alteriqipengyuania halimionae TaxID=1926630 RepID=A0A6I4U4B3_9SPHN|nr:hypothetical protein [Alteriqipengyuania halimionae]MXP09292.1 hypothetical protein [Alteriqipengyuania halimionae]